MSNEPAEAVFHAGMLLQLYDETKNVDEVTQVATARWPRAPRTMYAGSLGFFQPSCCRCSPNRNTVASSRCSLPARRATGMIHAWYPFARLGPAGGQ